MMKNKINIFNKNNKKAEGLSMQTIVVAIIVVIVLIVVIAIFVMNMNKSNDDFNNKCLKMGGVCKTDCGDLKKIGKCSNAMVCCGLGILSPSENKGKLSRRKLDIQGKEDNK